MKKFYVALMIFLIFQMPVHASVFGSNLGVMGYPKPTCMKPWNKPMQPYSMDQYAIQSYNTQVDNYNQSVREFNRCLDTYLQAARNDIDAISSHIRAARTGTRQIVVSFGPSNLGFLGYPSVQMVCSSQFSQEDMDECVLKYIRSAQNDVDEIVATARAL